MSTLRDYIDSRSVQELRELLEILCDIYILRPESSPPPDAKYIARSKQKSLAELLAQTDTDWGVRESMLNMGRALYYAPATEHPYYKERLFELLKSVAKKLGTPKLGEDFQQAAEAYDQIFKKTVGTTHYGTDLLEANQKVVNIASHLIEKALQKPDITFSKSDSKILTGVVSPRIARQLKEAK